MLISKGWNLFFGFGSVLIITGIIIIIIRPQDIIVDKMLSTIVPLTNGSLGFDIWKSVQLEFTVYLFHVLNPTEVQEKGEIAILDERGPYVYDAYIERIPIAINESTDTIDYMEKRTMIFNASKSGDLSDMDELTILNPAHIGSILVMESILPSLVPKFGNSIRYLFSDPDTIFIRSRVKDILFDGIPITCDTKIHKEIGLICTILKGPQRPPNVRITENEGIYLFSLFHDINGTKRGPLTVSRGLKDKYTTGTIVEYKKSSYINVWGENNCSIVKGTDSVFWPPMKSPIPKVFTFAMDACRSLHAVYVTDKIYNGVIGYQYRTSNNLWKNRSEDTCYCPRKNDGTLACPPVGALDLKSCKKIPVVMTEPHFIHGSESLFSITTGLNPIEDKHATFIVVEPLTGVPLSGGKRSQLNIMLQPEPVPLFLNVSEGIFPLFWLDEGGTTDQKLMEPIIILHRIIRLLDFIMWLPFLFGISIVAYWYLMKSTDINGKKYLRTENYSDSKKKNTPDY